MLTAVLGRSVLIECDSFSCVFVSIMSKTQKFRRHCIYHEILFVCASSV